jgi:long-chain acyl-CoA synthetase
MGSKSVALTSGFSLLPLESESDGDTHELRTYDDALLLKLTSGSSGDPKAVHVTEANLWNDARHIVEAMGIGPHDVNYGVIPISHSYGLGNLVAPLFLQGTPIALRDLFLPNQMLEDVATHGISVLPGVPILFRQVVDRYRGMRLPPSLRLLVSAGARIDLELVSDFKKTLGLKIHSFYGSSETGGITYDDEEEIAEPLHVGRPIPETEVTLGAGAGSTDEGQILVRGNAVSRGYVDGADGDRDGDRNGVARFIEGGFTSGDLGRFDEHGRLYLTGRLSSFVNVAGRKVDPNEAERALLSMPEIDEAKVIGVPCDIRGEKLVAFVVPSSGQLEPMRIRSYCATKLAPHKIPRDVVVLDAMPLTARGKVDRQALVAMSSMDPE